MSAPAIDSWHVGYARHDDTMNSPFTMQNLSSTAASTCPPSLISGYMRRPPTPYVDAPPPTNRYWACLTWWKGSRRSSSSWPTTPCRCVARLA